MSNKLFANFPEIQYKQDGKIITVKDYFRKAKVEAKALESVVEYEYYDLGNGERPDVVASKLYGDGDLHWVFFMINDIDNYYDWYKDSETFNNYMTEKYSGQYLVASQTSDIITTSSKFLVGESISSASQSAHVVAVEPLHKRIKVDKEVFVGGSVVTGANSSKSFTVSSVLNPQDAPHHYKNSDGIKRTDPADGFTAVSNFEVESEKNEERRTIKIIKPNYIRQVVSQFERVISK